MSWWVYLEDREADPWCSFNPNVEFKPLYEGDVRCNVPCYPAVSVDSHSEGGTYVMGGIGSAELNVTYNYSPLLYDALGFSFRELTDKQAHEVIRPLEQAVDKLGLAWDSNYWAATPGNAGRALATLLSWARQHPSAYFRVS